MSVESVITKHLPGMPQGNPGALRSAAGWWNTVANGLRSTIDDAQARISSLSASWQGDAKAAFEQEWAKLAGAVRDGCDELSSVASALDQAASKLENAQHAYEVAIGAAAITATIGLALTVVTIGASDAAAGPVMEAEVGTAVAVAAEATSTISALLSSAATIAVQLAERFVVLFGANLVAQAGLSAVVYPDHDPFGHINVEAALVAALSALPPFGAASVGGKMFVAGAQTAATNAALQEFTTGKIDPGEVLFSGAVGAATAGVFVGGSKIFSSIAARTDDAAADGSEFEINTDRSLGNDTSIGGKFRENEYNTALLVQRARRVWLDRFQEDGSADWIDIDGKTYDAIGPVKPQIFDQQWPQIQFRIVDHMSYADFVPVDVTGLTPEQVAIVRKFTEPLGSRVFIVGD